jgi:hypothetical protein
LRPDLRFRGEFLGVSAAEVLQALAQMHFSAAGSTDSVPATLKTPYLKPAPTDHPISDPWIEDFLS